MKKFWLGVAFGSALAAAVYSQNPTPAPTPTPSEDQDVVKISTNLIQVDVTVTDSAGQPITNIRPEEIEIYQNGKKQEISNFSFVSGARPYVKPSTEKRDPTDKNAISMPQIALRPESVHRTIAILIDDLSLSFESAYQTRRALKKFVDEQMQAGDLVAIIRTGAGIGALQQFTNDKRRLYAAIENARYNPAQGSLFAGGGSTSQGAGIFTSDGLDGQTPDLRQTSFSVGTLGTLSYVVDGMRQMPGRKSVMLFSEGFLFNLQDAEGFGGSYRVRDAMHRLVDKANRASVVIYTVDPRRPQSYALGADTGGVGGDMSGMAPGANGEAMIKGANAETAADETLIFLSKQTGGLFLKNRNEFSGQIRKILDDQSYYLVGYQPDEGTFDPKEPGFNKLVVKVTRSGANVRYRSGFMGVTDDQMKKIQLTENGKLIEALISPFAANDISLGLNALFDNDANGSFIRTILHVQADDLKLTDEPDGTKNAVFDIYELAFGDNGVTAGGISRTYKVPISKEAYSNFLKSGLTYNIVFPMKGAGAYEIRVALRDHRTGKIGTANQFVEFPDLKKNRLALSGAFLENISYETLKKRQTATATDAANNADSDPLTDTSLRRFKRGSILNYGFAVFNAKTGSNGKPNLTIQTNVYCDGKLIFEGKPKPISTDRQNDPQKINVSGSLNLGTKSLVGDYVLKITVKDENAKEKQQISTQFVQFEVIE